MIIINQYLSTAAVVAGDDTDALAFFAAMEGDASPVTLNTTQKSSINQLVLDMKSAGVWTKMKAIYPLIGGTASSHKWNLKDPRDLNAAFRLSFSGSPTHSANGIAWNGSSQFANTNLVPSTTLGQFSSHISYYTRDNLANLDACDMGSFSGGAANRLVLFISYTDGNIYGQANASATATSAVNTSSIGGFYINSRTANNAMSLYKNGTSISTNTTTETAALPNVASYLGALNNSGAISLFTTRQCAFATIGDGLTSTEASAMQTAVQNYQTSNSRQV